MTILYKDLIVNKSTRDKMRHRVNNAIKRCYNKTNISYPRYGAIGIQVFSEWLLDKRTFIQYLMTLTGWDNLTLELDRIDSTKNYEPGNLRFVTRTQQARNKDYGLKILYHGKQWNLKDFWETYIRPKRTYRHIQNLVRYWKDITGEQILERIRLGIFRSISYAR